MFTGIVEEMGKVSSIDRHVKGARLKIDTPSIFEDVKLGDSISVNGCCLTIVNYRQNYAEFDVVEETLKLTNLKQFNVGDSINLERAVRPQDRIGGHFVQGHIDGTGELIHKERYSDESWWVTVKTLPSIMRYLILKGSIAVDGVSLTIAKLEEDSFSFAMIPHTAQVTTLGVKKKGDLLNLEVDLMAKYVERLIHPITLSSKG